MGDIWDDRELLLENRQARAREKGGGGGLSVKGRDVKHAYITYSFYTLIMLQRDLFFLSISVSHH